MSCVYNKSNGGECPCTACDKKIEGLCANFEKKKVAVDDKTQIERNLATIIHNQTCHHNHTDQCGWHYGWEEFNLQGRDRYLEKAKKILMLTDYETAATIISYL